MAVILTDEGQDDQLARLIAAEASNLRVGLYTARTGAGKAVTIVSITVATYSGYAAQTPAWSPIADSAAGRSKQEAVELTYAHSGGGVANTITGWYLFNSSTNKLWFYEDFVTAITLDSSGDNIKVKPTLYFGDLTAPL